MRSEELNHWMMAKLKESYYLARQEGDQRKGTGRAAGRCHTVLCVLSMPPVAAPRLHLLGLSRTLVRDIWWPVQLEGPEQSLVYSRRCGFT